MGNHKTHTPKENWKKGTKERRKGEERGVSPKTLSNPPHLQIDIGFLRQVMCHRRAISSFRSWMEALLTVHREFSHGFENDAEICAVLPLEVLVYVWDTVGGQLINTCIGL